MAGHRAKYISPPSPLGGDKPTPAQPPKETLRASTCQELCVWVVKSDCGVACILFPRQEVWGSERDRDLPGNSQQLSWEVDPEFWRLRSLCIEKEVNPIRDLPRATRRSSVQFSSVTQSCPTLCDPMDCSTSGFPVHHQFLEFTQTHVHRIHDAIQPSHPLLSPSPPVFNLSQHQSLFQ